MTADPPNVVLVVDFDGNPEGAAAPPNGAATLAAEVGFPKPDPPNGLLPPPPPPKALLLLLDGVAATAAGGGAARGTPNEIAAVVSADIKTFNDKLQS